MSEDGRGHDPTALALTAPHGDADGRPVCFLRGDLGRTQAPGGQHWSDERPLSCAVARAARSFLSRTERIGVYPAATVRLDFRVASANLGHKVGDE
jgi:hypothetical protein